MSTRGLPTDVAHEDPATAAAATPPGPGGIIEIVGPDGVGKSVVCDGLLEGPFQGMAIRRMHHRPGVLPSRGGRAGPVSDPHRDAPYPPLLARAKACYVFLDYLLGWMLRIRPFVRRGGWVIMERGWWDVVVDPARYRLRRHPRMLAALGRVLPASHLMVVLSAPAEQIYARKSELPLEEIERQLRTWRELAPGVARQVSVDASQPLPQVIEQVRHEVARVVEARAASSLGAGWVGLPRRRSPRWTVPRGPRAVAVNGLLIHHPVTLLGHVYWEAARLLASLGLFRLLPRSAPPSPELRAMLAPYLDDGSALAVARGNSAGRCTALVLDRQGRGRFMAKIETSERGRRKLQREVQALADLGGAVPPPMVACKLLDQDDAVIVFEAERWRPRLRPWVITEEVARALGAFWRSGAAEWQGRLVGFGHGDFAPWNLLHTRRGWVLLDWEDGDDRVPAFFDLFHYLVQGHALLRHPSLGVLLRGLRGRGWVGRAIRGYAEGAALPVAQAKDQLIAYLEAGQERLRGMDTREGRRALTARRRLLAAARGLGAIPELGADQGRRRAVAPGLARRAAWGLGDQMLSSLTNFAVGILVARALGATDFGAFTLVFSTYLLALNVSRALGTEPLVVRFSDAPLEDWRRAVGLASGTAVVVGAVGGLVCLLAAWMLGGSVGAGLVGLGLLLPGLLLQDSWRFVFFSRRRGASAFLNDLVWAVALVPALGLALGSRHVSVMLLVLAWGGAATVAALAGVQQARELPRPQDALTWLREQRDLAPRYLGEFMTQSGATQLCFLGIGAIAGLASVGSLRAAQVLLGPLSMLFMAISMVAVPEAVRILGRSAKEFVALSGVVSAGLGSFVLLWGVALLLLPTRLGLRILGPSWQPARQVLLPMTLMATAIAVTIGAQLGLRALAAARRSFRARILVSLLSVVGALLGAELGGSGAAAWGLAVASSLGAPIWWWEFANGLVEGPRGRPRARQAATARYHDRGAREAPPPAAER